MVDSCYICRRTQVDLDHLNEEVRTRAYLSYFSNARSQIEDQSREINFLQRIQDEESGDPHFRINARQVFSDPEAYKKLMPWIETLMDIAKEHEKRPDDPRTIGELVPELLARERHLTAQMEQGLIELRGGFATGGKSPLSLEVVTYAFPGRVVDRRIRRSPGMGANRTTGNRFGGISRARKPSSTSPFTFARFAGRLSGRPDRSESAAVGSSSIPQNIDNLTSPNPRVHGLPLAR